jgi:hypothetical protein
MRGRLGFVALVAAAGLKGQAPAPTLQQTCRPGTIRAIVRDSQESSVFDAQVRLVSGTREFARRSTETEGVADFDDVPCGTWTVRASKEGFEDGQATVQIDGAAVVESILTLTPQIGHSTMDVTDTAPPVEQSSAQNYEIRPAEVAELPTNPATITETLPLVPGVVRSPTGELRIDGSGEQRSSLVVNQSDVTDPATGAFGQTVPSGSIDSVNVLNTPFLAQYGRFTQSVIAVETKRGGDKWHFDLNDPFPDPRVRSYHLHGFRNEQPRASLGGPLVRNRLYFMTSLLYFLNKAPSRTLGFPFNESKQERINSFTQVDFIVSQRQIVNATLHYTNEHTNFVNPDFFNPQPATPTYAQRNWIGTVGDHLGLWGGTVDSSVSFQRFHAFVGSQGGSDFIMTPAGNRGNFFGAQERDAARTEWLEIWSPAPLGAAGTHLPKIGTSLTTATGQGDYDYRSIDILNIAGRQIQRIDFSQPPAFDRSDLEFTAYAQDHWSPVPRISLDYGVRFEHQRLAQSFRIAPRAGAAWTPFTDGRTVFRIGYGQFYDHIPLDVYTFGRYPNRTVTDFAPDGSVAGVPIQFTNVIGSVTGPSSFFVHSVQVAGAFSPRGATLNAQIEHRFERLLRLRAVYTNNRSVGLLELEPNLLGTSNEIVLNGDGKSRYRQLELTANLAWSGGQQLVFAWTHSRAEGNLNGFDSFLGNFPLPLIRPSVYTNLPGDIPNRLLIWGHLNSHFRGFQLFPIVEYRSGFPYQTLNVLQQYVGTPFTDSTRYRRFFSADLRIGKDFRFQKFPKYTFRASVTGFNLTNHFNPLAVHNDIEDPAYGVFFGNYHRRYRFDLDVVF